VSAAALFACGACASGAATPPAASTGAAKHAANASGARSCEMDFEEAWALVNQGDLSVKVDIERALRSYEHAASFYPRDPRILWRLALVHNRREDWAKVTATMERAVELAPKHPPFWELLGNAWIQRAEAGDAQAYRRAIAPLKRCVALEPVADCYFLLGRAYEWTGDDHAALVAYALAAELDPHQSRFYTSLAELYLVYRLYGQAEAVLHEGVRVAPSGDTNIYWVYRMHVLLAWIASGKGDRAAQLSALGSAEKYMGERYPVLAFQLGVSYARMSPPTKEPAIRLLTRFSMTVCRGALAAKFTEECEQAASLLEWLGQ
jgi:tetratricopeptide (TPR) repeat protein